VSGWGRKVGSVGVLYRVSVAVGDLFIGRE